MITVCRKESESEVKQHALTLICCAFYFVRTVSGGAEGFNFPPTGQVRDTALAVMFGAAPEQTRHGDPAHACQMQVVYAQTSRLPIRRSLKALNALVRSL